MSTIERDKLILPVRTRSQYQAYLLQQNNSQANIAAEETASQVTNRESLTSANNEAAETAPLIINSMGSAVVVNVELPHNGSFTGEEVIGNIPSPFHSPTRLNRNAARNSPLQFITPRTSRASRAPLPQTPLNHNAPRLQSTPNDHPLHCEAMETEPKSFRCTICLEICLLNEPTAAACGHIFCEMCINVHIALSPTNPMCPNCRSVIAGSTLFRIYP